jgi:hypothetical protein
MTNHITYPAKANGKIWQTTLIHIYKPTFTEIAPPDLEPCKTPNSLGRRAAQDM